MIAVPTDIELVDAAAGTYVRNGPKPVIDDASGALRAFMTTRDDGLCIVAFEGTYDPIGWLLDFAAIPTHPMMLHSDLGLVHAGFFAPAQAAMPKLAFAIGNAPYAMSGHSRGAAFALLCGALMIASGARPPLKIGAFAPPRVGSDLFVKIATSVPFCAYKFGDDPVPEVPFTIPPDFLYRQVLLEQIGPAPSYGSDPVDVAAGGDPAAGGIPPHSKLRRRRSWRAC